MASLVVITFDNEDEAEQVRKAIQSMQRQGHISLDDSAVVVKHADGKVSVKNEVDRGVKVGAVGGSLIGLLIGSIFFPIGGLVLGAAGGALVGKMADMGVDKKFVKEVTDALQPGNSAIFLLVRNADPNASLAALKPYAGTVYHTSLDSEAEESLRRVLSSRE